MNFSFDASKMQGAAQAPTTTATTGFSLGNMGAGDAGKNAPTLGMQKPLFGTTSTPSFGSNLTLGTPATAATGAATGLTFGATSSAPATTLSFGMTTSTPLPGFGSQGIRPTGNISFGNLGTPSTGFTLGSAPAPPATTATLSFGGAATSTPATGFNLGGTPATVSTAAPLSFGLPTTGFPAATTTPSTGLKLPSSIPPSTGTGFSLKTTTAAPATTSIFNLSSSAATTSAPATGFNLGTTPSTISTGFSLAKTTAATTTTSAISTGAPQTSLGSITTVSSSASSMQTGAINFCQLEEAINKWTLELEEQEKVFVNQASQVNAWDKLLIANGEKIVTLNQEVERVKLEQQQLEHELDYVVGQQKELQDCLVPLEKELASVSVTDPEREYTYRLAEKLDTQMKQMSEDLKEIIEHLNEANRAQDSSDPIVQISKILNAHMNSLQWIDQRTAVLSQKINSIDQMHQNFRQETERSLSLAYN